MEPAIHQIKRLSGCIDIAGVVRYEWPKSIAASIEPSNKAELIAVANESVLAAHPLALLHIPCTVKHAPVLKANNKAV
jgi:hypothetical protein